MADLTCGSGGSTGMEIITQINSNTHNIEDHETRITQNTTDIASNLAAIQSNDSDISTLDSRITSVEGDISTINNTLTTHENRLDKLEGPAPRATVRLANETTVTLTDDSTPIVLPIFDTIVTQRGGFGAVLNDYTLVNINAPDQLSVIMTVGINVRFPGTETLELQLYKNGQPYSSADFYLRGTGDNKPNAFFWQSDITLNAGDTIDLRGRNAATGSVDITFVRTQFRIDGSPYGN